MTHHPYPYPLLLPLLRPHPSLTLTFAAPPLSLTSSPSLPSQGAVRTVTALNAQPFVINRYRRFLFDAMRVGIHKGLKVGLGNGLLFGACFLTYALGFWYGGILVADSVKRMCIPTLGDPECVSGGRYVAVV